MKQHNSAVIKKDAAQFEKWCFQQTVELEHTKERTGKFQTRDGTPSEGVRIPEAEIRDGEES